MSEEQIFQLMMPAQLFDGLSQLTKISHGLPVGSLIDTFNVVGTFNPYTLNVRRNIHTHSISVGTSIHTQYPRHIHPDSITVGTSIHIQYPAAHPSTLNRCRHILTSTLILRRQIHPYSISFGTSIHPQYRLAHTIIHLSTQYLSANQFLLNLCLMVNTCQKKFARGLTVLGMKRP